MGRPPATGGDARIDDLFPPEDRRRIGEAVIAAESRTSGEIRVKVLERCDADLRESGDPGDRVERQALREFVREGIDRTREGTGVLLLLVLEDRRFRILGDRGIHARLPPGTWEGMAEALSGRLRAGAFTEGICATVAAVGERLAAHFPRRDDDANELPDAPAFGSGPRP